MVDWSVKLNQFQQVLSQEITDLNNQRKKAPPFSHQRLDKLIEGKTEFLQQVSQLVSPILKAKVASKPVYDAMSDRAPTTQNLLSYEANLYRDWVWGEKENKLSLEILLKLIGKEATGNLLVLGAGSARLAYDLHAQLNPNLTIANDINPLLLFAAKEIIKGKGLNIYEFPAYPISSDSVAINHSIDALDLPPDNFHFLFSDAAKPALKKASIDLLITPWLIDIQPVELGKFVSSLNYYLPVGGIWCNFGSLVFNQSRDAFCYSIDEIKDILAQNGFELECVNQDQMPYLHSPYNAGYRVETVYSWRAKKVKDVTFPAIPDNLPDWIIDTQKPVTKTREIMGQAFSNQMYADILNLVDGKRSMQQIAKKIAVSHKIDESESLAMLKQFLVKLI